MVCKSREDWIFRAAQEVNQHAGKIGPVESGGRSLNCRRAGWTSARRRAIADGLGEFGEAARWVPVGRQRHVTCLSKPQRKSSSCRLTGSSGTRGKYSGRTIH